MYVCGICREQQGPGVAVRRVVTQVREMVPKGHETVKEVLACHGCAATFRPPAVHPEKKAYPPDDPSQRKAKRRTPD